MECFRDFSNVDLPHRSARHSRKTLSNVHSHPGNSTNSPTILFHHVDPQLRCSLTSQFFCHSIKARNRGSPASALHFQILAVTKREQWQDPDTSNSVSLEARRYLCGE
jgi:hypothetical protein